MKVEIKKLLEGAKDAKGLAVAIDVIRASTTIASLLSKGAGMILPVSELEEAYKLKRENPEYVLLGERHGLKPKGFDYGNSPAEIKDINLKGRTIVMTTSNGTKGIINARNADEIIVGGFVNLDAVFEYIVGKNPEIVSLLALGSSNVNAPEDEIFAECLKAKLEGRDYSLSNLEKRVMESRSVKMLTRIGYSKDISYCLKLSTYNIVPKVFKEGSMLVIKNAG